MPDRIETGTFLVRRRGRPAATCVLHGAAPTTLDAVIDKLREAGAHDRGRRRLDPRRDDRRARAR